MPNVYTTKPVTLLTVELKTYCLTYREGEKWPFWLANSEGEGLALPEKDLEEILHRYFKEHF